MCVIYMSMRITKIIVALELLPHGKILYQAGAVSDGDCGVGMPVQSDRHGTKHQA
jgi:hypothetical protein